MSKIQPEVITSINALYVAVHRLEVFIKKTAKLDLADPSDQELREMLQPASNEALRVAYNALESIQDADIGCMPGEHGAFEKLKAGALEPKRQVA